MFDFCFLQTFEGPQTGDEPLKVLFPEELEDVKYVKIIPTETNNGEPVSMQVELLGCIEESKKYYVVINNVHTYRLSVNVIVESRSVFDVVWYYITNIDC